MNWNNKKWFIETWKKQSQELQEAYFGCSEKNGPLINVFQACSNADYGDVKVKTLRIELCNQNILINAE